MKYNDETQRVTRRNIAISLGLAILLVALILVSAVIYGCNRPQEMVKPPVDTPQPEQPGDVTNDIGEELSSGIVYPMPKSMLFSSPTSESTVAAAGVTLQATVLPSNAADLSVNWTVAFVNPLAAWAEGKDPYSYVTVAPSSPGSAIATVTCLKAFGEQIVIEVSSTANPDAAASCIVDYSARFLSLSGLLHTGMSNPTVAMTQCDSFDSLSDPDFVETLVSANLFFSVSSVFSYGLTAEFSDYTYPSVPALEMSDTCFVRFNPSFLIKAALSMNVTPTAFISGLGNVEIGDSTGYVSAGTIPDLVLDFFRSAGFSDYIAKRDAFMSWLYSNNDLSSPSFFLVYTCDFIPSSPTYWACGFNMIEQEI